MERIPKSRESEWRRIRDKYHMQFDVTDDIDEAVDIVAELLRSGVRPTITVPPEHIDYVRKHGIPEIPKPDLSGKGEHYSIIAGRLGVDPFFSPTEPAGRYLMEVDPVGLRIGPRMTGPDRAFYGTVVFSGYVPAANLREVGHFTPSSYEAFVRSNNDTEDRLAAK